MLNSRPSREGLYIHFLLGGQKFAALCLGGQPPAGSVAAVTLIDALLRDRVDAMQRFQAALLRTKPILDARITPLRRRHLAEILRAVDGVRAGATYQEIAEAVFGAERVSAIVWKSLPLRDTVMRRVRSGHNLVRGGYRMLLSRHRAV